MMNEKCNHYVKVCFKKTELIYKRFYLIVFLEICKPFNFMPKGLEAMKKFFVGGTFENFEKKWDTNLCETETKSLDLLLEEHCEKLFCLMDSFWEEIAGTKIDLNCLLKHCVKSVHMRSFFWSVFSCIRTEYGDLRSKSSHSVRIHENTDQKKIRIWTLFTQ